MEKLEITVPFLYSQKRIDAFLAEAMAGRYSRQEIKAALLRGEIFLNGKPARPSAGLSQGDVIGGSISAVRAATLTPEHIPLSVIYEDEDMLVVDKPAGMVVHPGAGNKKGTLVHALLGRGIGLSSLGGNERPGIVHRLDKDTSGLLVIAKNNAAHRRLQAQFETRTLTKTYTALVRGAVAYDEGHIDKSIAPDKRMRLKMAVSTHESAKAADTRYRVLRRFSHSTLLEVRILTGRTHQIRVHMAYLGNPVVGDKLYGSALPQERLALHASKLEFVHPTSGKTMSFESPLPQDMRDLISRAEAA